MIDSFSSVWIVLGVILALPVLFSTRDHDGGEHWLLPFMITWLGLTAIGGFLYLIVSLSGAALSSPIALFIGILALIVFLGARKPSQKVE